MDAIAQILGEAGKRISSVDRSSAVVHPKQVFFGKLREMPVPIVMNITDCVCDYPHSAHGAVKHHHHIGKSKVYQ